MSRIYFDREIEDLKIACDRTENEFNRFLDELVNNIDEIIIEIQEERLTDIQEINDALKEFRDSIN